VSKLVVLNWFELKLLDHLLECIYQLLYTTYKTALMEMLAYMYGRQWPSAGCKACMLH
jgi:hypothetical protein